MPKSRSDHDTGPVYSARGARQGDIVMRKPWQRGVFIAGLVGAIVLALILVVVGVHFGQAYREQQARSPSAQIGMI